MKHCFLIILLISVITTGIFLPYMPGDYDYFAVGLSCICQFAAFISLLLVPVGLTWCIKDFTRKNKNRETVLYPFYLKKIALVITVFIIPAAALGAFASHNRFSAIIILISGVFILIKIHKKINNPKSLQSIRYSAIPYYFIFIPLAVLYIRTAFIEKVKNQSTAFVIKQSEQLIQDIEAYKNTNGHYPVSLQSTIEDYHTFVSGIPRFQYELHGNAYNLYFEQFSDMIGTQEIVMYNKLDEQQMTVHNQDLLRIPYNNILHGYHKVVQLPDQHWKIFYFD